MSRRSTWRLRALGVVVVWAATACAVAPTGTPTPPPTPAVVRVAASDLAASLVADLAAAYRSERPDVVVVLEPLGADTSEIEIGADLGRVPSGFRTPLGATALAAVVAADFSAPPLSDRQLAALLSGTVEDWSQLGGPPGAVTVFARDRDTEAAAVVAARLGLAALSPQARLVPSWVDLRVAVAQTPGAIGILPLPETDTSVTVVATVDLGSVAIEARALNEPTGAARDFLAWAQSPAGQAIVAQRHERPAIP